MCDNCPLPGACFGREAHRNRKAFMATTEHTINDELAALLRETRRAWYASDVVRSENTEALKMDLSAALYCTLAMT